MLKTRIITGLILAPIVVAAIYLLPLWAVGLFVLLATSLAIYEWGALAGLEGVPRVVYLVVYILLGVCAWLFPEFWQPLLVAVAIAWGVAVVIVLAHPRANALIGHPMIVALLGYLIALGASVAVVDVRAGPSGAHWVMWMLLICWAADVGAYFAGRAYGKRKLAPSVSPGKTWEGALGGGLLALVVCGGLLAYAGAFEPIWVVLMVLLIAISVIGDLFESVLKRKSAIKDSGSLLPGHGGMLDRIDSVLAVAPFVALLLPMVR